MGIMVYAKFGRTGVYQLQDLLRLINGGEADLRAKVANARKVLALLPESNWFSLNERYLTDHKNLGDGGLVDLLLHEQDVAFSIDEVHALLRAAELHLVEFCDVKMRMLLRPELLIRDDALLQKVAALDDVTQQRVAELFVGMIKQHIFYAAMTPGTQAAMSDLSDVPFFMGPDRAAQGARIAEQMRHAVGPTVLLRHESGLEIEVGVHPLSAAIFRQIDGLRDWKTIFAAVRATAGGVEATDTDFLEFFRPTFEQFRQLDWMLLRGAGVGQYPDTVEMQRESQRR
jgi:hypothetical protein